MTSGSVTIVENKRFIVSNLMEIKNQESENKTENNQNQRSFFVYLRIDYVFSYLCI